jgi:hypothetical protein
MKSRTVRRIAAPLALAAVALLVLGCSDDATQPNVTPKPRYPEATTKEIVISNFLKSYEDRNIEQFAKLLHPDYIWYNQPGLTPEFYTRSEDIEKTGNMFSAALHTYPNSALWLDKLELKLNDGVWTQIVEYDGSACDDCWETTRDYYIELYLPNAAMTLLHDDLVRFVVVPAEEGGPKVYRIIRCDDLRRPW